MKTIKPPLPFLGNKRNALKNYKKVLIELKEYGLINENTLILDLYGGSGLLSHVAKQMLPYNEVIWNDYDNYQERLNHIADTEKLRQDLQDFINLNIKDVPDYKKAFTKEQKVMIITFLTEYEKNNYIDFITLSSFLLFGGTYKNTLEKLAKHTLFSAVPQSEIKINNYLQGVTRVYDLAENLMQKYKNHNNKLLILDPPYLQTIVGNYKQSFTLSQFLNMFKYITKPYILFGSKRSDILPFFEFFKEYSHEIQNFTYKQGLLNINSDFDYIIYPQPSLLL